MVATSIKTIIILCFALSLNVSACLCPSKKDYSIESSNKSYHSNVVAEYYIENTADEDYHMLILSRILKPLPQVSFSEYKKQFSWRSENYWGMEISIPKANLSFVCERNSYETIYETGRTKAGIKLQPIEHISVLKKSNFEQYINKNIPVQWNIKASKHSQLSKAEPEIKGTFLIRIIAKDSAANFTIIDACSFPTTCQLPVSEKCKDLKLLKIPDYSIELLSKTANLDDVIFQNIPENCSTVFIPEKLYSALNKNQTKILNDKIAKIGVKFSFADEIHYCERNEDSVKEPYTKTTIIAGACHVEARNHLCNIDDEGNAIEKMDYLFSFGKYKYLLKSDWKNDYTLDCIKSCSSRW